MVSQSKTRRCVRSGSDKTMTHRRLAPADQPDNGGGGIEKLQRQKRPASVDQTPRSKQECRDQQKREAKHLVAGIGRDQERVDHR